MIHYHIFFFCYQEQRLRGRGTETEEAVQKRLGRAKAEMDYGKEINSLWPSDAI